MNNSWLTGTLTHKIVLDRDLKPKRLRNTALDHCFSTAGTRPDTGSWNLRETKNLSKNYFCLHRHLVRVIAQVKSGQPR